MGVILVLVPVSTISFLVKGLDFRRLVFNKENICHIIDAQQKQEQL